MLKFLFTLLGSLCLGALGSAACHANELPLLKSEDFENGLAEWTTTDPPGAKKVWLIKAGVRRDEHTDHYLRVTGPSKYQPPHRSPYSIVWSRKQVDGNVELSTKLQNTNPKAGPHRDLCLFWGGQDDAHYYYVHLGAKADPHSCQIMIVNGADRKAITLENENSTPWTDSWHTAKLRHDVETGLIEVFFDDMQKPRMTARDKTFTWGKVGLGTFDDNGNFDDVDIRGKVKPPSKLQTKVTSEKNDSGVLILADGKPFAEYLTKSGHQPAIWPIIGPTGKPVTRSFPLGPLLESERRDHPHHRSLWFAHGDVNGHDFWSEPRGDHDAQIVHREFVNIDGPDNGNRIVTRNDWVSQGKKICEDERTVVFGEDPDGSRWIDFTIELKATDGDVTFGDTKEGTFAMRLAGTMKVDAKLGGQLLNTQGQKDADSWGQPAAWLDASGPVEGETVGVTIFSHPNNFRHPVRWHARNYGLIAANPFGQSDFPAGEQKQGAYTIEQGNSLKLRYKVWLHKGRRTQEQLHAKSQSVFENNS